jgi:voltage-gated potassium channel
MDDTDQPGAAAPRARSLLGGRGRRGRVASEPLRLGDLDPAQRRRAILVSIVTIALSTVLVVGAYYLLPFDRGSNLRTAVRLSADVALFGAVFAWEIRRIAVAQLPELRAIEALGVVIGLFLVGFSAVYLSMSNGAPWTFTQQLDHTRALYFTITVFSTVGFGDITPRTDAARIVVSLQMLLDLAIIGAVVRLIFNAARSRVASESSAGGG